MTHYAFLGLGVMGFPMAGHLSTKSGGSVTVYNRNADKSAAWAKKYQTGQYQAGANRSTIAEAVKEADFVMMCVGDDPDVWAVAAGEEGALHHMKKGAILVDHTTASAKIARDVASLAAEKGIGFVDAPVSGGQAGAENGVLTIMCGGSEADFDKAHPHLMHYARSCARIGPAGSGQLAKMVNQIAIAGLVQGLSEAIAFGQKAEIDMETVLDVITKGAAGSWQMENRGRTMLADKFDFGFAVDWMRKDLRICLDESRANGARLPVTAMVDQFYAALQARGGNRQDTSSLIQLLKD